ncbi:MAG TPA: ABC transporter permease subunit [Steroidobacteraceae bacterium]|nr:ABC transporter permease subunit [Steroidobacteraceae bacterium]
MADALAVELGSWARTWSRLRRSRSARVATVALCAIALLAILGPLWSRFPYDRLDWQHIAAPPLTSAHWLGTDRLGRDLYVRTLYGVRLSLAIGLTASVVSVLIGVAWGATAGFIGGRVDSVMMRIVDVLNSLPYLFLVIAFTTVFGRGNPYALFAAIGAVGWITMARIVRAQALSLRRRLFIEAAVASGAHTPRILARHIVPNVLGPVAVYAALTVPQMILFESFLSFLGLGVQEPSASLGTLIHDGAEQMGSAPWLLIVPASLLVALLLGFNLLGDGLRDALDPRDQTGLSLGP